ncbi:MAG: hypothetical protein ACLTG4_06110 [Oscillospiraceae bacterium]
MRNYMEEYQRWLDSPALSNAEWDELNAIRDDKKEIESRFFAPLEFGTAGLRGEMALGCRRMNIHVIRHATQAFAEVIKAEGESACARGIAICFDCRVNSERFAHEAAGVMRPTASTCAFSTFAPDAGAVVRRQALRHHGRPEHHGQPQSERV